MVTVGAEPYRLEGSAQIRDALRTGPRVALIGADWIGLESAIAGRIAAISASILPSTAQSVSYTHLTLPTNREV